MIFKSLINKNKKPKTVKHLSTYTLINLSTYKRKDCSTMTKNENVNEALEANALTKRHSEGIRPKNPLHILKRFFAEYKFPFAGNSIRPAQNDGKLLVPQCLSNLVPFSPLSLPSPSVLLRSHKTGTAIAFHPLLACARGEGYKNIKHLFTYSLQKDWIASLAMTGNS